MPAEQPRQRTTAEFLRLYGTPLHNAAADEMDRLRDERDRLVSLVFTYADLLEGRHEDEGAIYMDIVLPTIERIGDELIAAKAKDER